jgi:hypothetical protein
MKVAFLDIDGVLNSMASRRVRGPIPRGVCFLSEAYAKWAFSRTCILQANRLADAGVKFVLSSAWRGRFEETTKLLELADFTGEFVGSTPVIEGEIRGAEIQAWLDLHPEVEDFVILDDDDDMGALDHRHIESDFEVGLTETDVDRAFELLGLHS